MREVALALQQCLEQELIREAPILFLFLELQYRPVERAHEKGTQERSCAGAAVKERFIVRRRE